VIEGEEIPVIVGNAAAWLAGQRQLPRLTPANSGEEPEERA
jgi:hypothetical protein